MSRFSGGTGSQQAYETSKRGVDVLDDIFEQIDTMRKARESKAKADRDYQVQLRTLDLNARDKGIGTVSQDPQTGRPVLKPFTIEEQEARIRQKQAVQLAAFGIPMSLGPVGSPASPTAMPQTGALPVPAAPPAAATMTGGAPPAAPVPVQQPAAAAPKTAAGGVQTTAAGSDYAQVAGTPFAVSGYTVGPNGPSVSYKRISEIVKDIKDAQGNAPSAEQIKTLLAASRAIRDLQSIKKAALSGKFKTGPITAGGEAKYHDIPWYSNYELQTSSNSREEIRLRALERLMQSNFLTAQTGAQRGFKEIAFLLPAVPSLKGDLPKNLAEKADIGIKRFQADLEDAYAQLSESGFNANGVKAAINRAANATGELVFLGDLYKIGETKKVKGKTWVYKGDDQWEPQSAQQS